MNSKGIGFDCCHHDSANLVQGGFQNSPYSESPADVDTRLLQPLESNRLSDCLSDAHRFTLFIFPPIRTTPLQIYSSLLIFAPTGSIVRQTFEKGCATLVIVWTEDGGLLESIRAVLRDRPWNSFLPQNFPAMVNSCTVLRGISILMSLS
jgi:hypothetical protein